MLQEARHAPRPPSRSCWPRPGRRLSGSNWIFPLCRASKERPLSSTGTLRSCEVPVLRTNPEPNRSKQGSRITHPVQQRVRMAFFGSKTSGAHWYSLFRGTLSPPEALTADGYEMTFGTSVLGWLIYTVSQIYLKRRSDILDCRTLLLHGATHPSII